MAEVELTEDQPGLLSIGHSNVALDSFLVLLAKHHIEVVADVRTAPRSRYVPHFDASPLREALTNLGLKYVYLGKELGGRPDGDEYYDEDDHVLYSRLAESPLFEVGLDRILEGAKEYRVAMLCSEEDPLHCHRHLLIGRVLDNRGVPLLHIRGDGTLQTEDELAIIEAGEQSQGALFDAPAEGRPWRSTRSVSRRKPHLTSLES